MTLTYDALSRMAEQNNSGSYTQIVYAPTGDKLALMTGQTLQKAFVPLPSGTAVYNSSGLAYYRHSDWLGSSRFASTPTTGAMYSSTAYAPFGEPYAQAGTTDLSFTGQNSDTVGGSYDFLFREYSTQGRWPSPDPAGLAAVDPSDPQSWNRYAYVLNNPTELVDPTGMCTDPVDGTRSPRPCSSDKDNVVHIVSIFGSGCTLDGTPWSCQAVGYLLQSGAAYIPLQLGPPWVPSGGYYRGTGCWTNTVTDEVRCPTNFTSLPIGGAGGAGGDSGDSWLGTAVKTFFTVPYRKPGETFTACWNRAASDTLVGMGVPREATPGTEALLGSAGTVGLFSSVKSIWALGNWVRPSSYLAKTVGAGSAGVRAARMGGQAMAASLAAEAGLRAGAALDCAIPVN